VPTASLLFLLPTALLAQSIIFQHATVIDGTGRVRREASLEIKGDRIAGINLPRARGAGTIDCHGKTIIPGIINAHGHLGVTRGTSTAPENYTPENIAAQLDQYARYGVTSMLSLGLNHDLIYDLRAKQRKGEFDPQGATIFTAGRGIGVPGGAPPLNVGDNQVYRPATAEEARADVREMAAHNPDIIKIWVDDIRGSMPKMQPEIYQAVIEEAHANHLRVAAHIYYMADAAALVDLGVDVLAHSIRDRDVDPALVRKMKQHGVFYIPTLELDDSFFHYADHPDLLKDPFLAGALNPELNAMLASREWRDKVHNDPATAKNHQAFDIALRNLKAIRAGGVNIAMGTDSGATPLRIQGYAEHLEMELMRRAGLSPMDILMSATSGSAEVCGTTDRGTLEAGKAADLIVLDEDPLEDIRNSRKIFAVWHNGLMVPLQKVNQ
jgi:imidazolonepropionase-like amidohydrolase